MSAKVRRGVHMTATARKPRPAWRDECNDEDTALPEEEREESRSQWSAVEKEVERERQKLRAAEGPTLDERKGHAVMEYEDVAGEAADEAEEEARRRRLLEESRSASSTATPLVASLDVNTAAEHGPKLPPEGVVTAGQASQAKKRGGEKKTGASKRKKREEDDEEEEAGGDLPTKKKRKKEDADGKKGKKKEDDDPDRWVKLKLQGEEKTKRIDATRVVHYHDFDARHGSAGVEPQEVQAPSGNFRAALRKDLWDDDSDDAGEK